MEFLTPALLGLVTGLLLGLTGAGGGLLAAPLLMLVMHLSVAQAAPISLLSVVLGAGLGMLMGLRLGTVRYRAALLIAGAGLLASPLGIHLSRILPNTLLAMAFATLLLYLAWRLWHISAAAQDDVLPCTVDGSTGRFIWNRSCARALAGSGLMAGFLSGLLGVGGGFVLVPALRRHTPLSMDSITATTLMVLTLLSLGGIAQWASHGEIEWHVALPFVTGTIVGMLFGRHFSPRIKEEILRRVFAAFCLATGAGIAAKILIAG